MNGLGKDYIWSELFLHFNAALLRKVEEIAHAVTELYCKRYSIGVDRIKNSKSIAHNTTVSGYRLSVSATLIYNPTYAVLN